MKKTLSLLVCLSMMFSLCQSVIAAEVEAMEKRRIAEYYCNETEFEEIVVSDNEEYAMLVDIEDEVVYQPIERMDMEVTNADSVETVLNNPDIPIEIRQEIENKYKQALEQGNDALTMTLFTAPSDLKKTALYSSDSDPTDDSIYATYKGMNMRADRLYSYNRSTPTEKIDKDNTAKETAKAMTSLGLGIAGMGSGKLKNIAYAASGISIFDSFMAANQSAIIPGHSGDFIEGHIVFDEIEKWTYGEVEPDAWQLGLESQQVTITKIYLRQYYFDNSIRKGREFPLNIYPGREGVLETPNYSNHWEKAYYCVFSTWTEALTYQFGSKYIMF